MFIASFFIMANERKQPKCSPNAERVNKMWYGYTMECYAAIP